MFGVAPEKNYKIREPKPMRPKRNPFSHLRLEWKKLIVWVGAAILVISLVAYYLYKNYYSNYNYIKQDSSQYLVYTVDSSVNSQNMTSEIPYINIDSDDANRVNNAILDFADPFLAKNKNNLMVYDSQLNGEVLSVLIRTSEYGDEYSFPTVLFYTYNFNLKTRNLMSNQEVLDIFGVQESDVEKIIEDKFHEYYNDEVYKGYLVSQECDYNCFLRWREVDNYLDNVAYFIKNGKLYAYRPFTIYSVYGEENYFTDDSFIFYIAG